MTTKTLLSLDAASLVVHGFRGFAFSRSAVRLDSADYGFRPGANPSEITQAREAYLGDRNQIRRASRDLQNSFREVAYLFREASYHPALASALIEASRGSRFEYVGGERGYNAYGKSWHYTAGQYQPTEIRWQAADVLRRTLRIYRAS